MEIEDVDFEAIVELVRNPDWYPQSKLKWDIRESIENLKFSVSQISAFDICMELYVMEFYYQAFYIIHSKGLPVEMFSDVDDPLICNVIKEFYPDTDDIILQKIKKKVIETIGEEEWIAYGGH